MNLAFHKHPGRESPIWWLCTLNLILNSPFVVSREISNVLVVMERQVSNGVWGSHVQVVKAQEREAQRRQGCKQSTFDIQQHLINREKEAAKPCKC